MSTLLLSCNFELAKVSVLWTVVFLLTSSIKADDGFWTAGNGSWASAGNWDSGIVADGTDDTAFFGVFADVPANLIVTLNGARTIGNLFFSDQSGADNITLNTGSGGPLTLDATFDLPFINVAQPNQRVTINAVLAGSAGLEKIGDGLLSLNSTNTYSGETLVSGGTLFMNGQLGTDVVTVASGRLSGTGVISGPITVQSGAILEPGNFTDTLTISNIGTLTISNTLTLQSGSYTRIELNGTTLNHDTVQGLSGVSYNGTLIVNIFAGFPTLGQSFQIFNAASASGNFANLTPQLFGGLRWKFEPANGVLSVVSSTSQPVIASAFLAESNFTLQATNGAPGVTNYVLTSTNLNLAKTNWTRLATNKFDVSGNLSFTNTVNPNTPQRFYLISATAGP